ncbi:DUF2868 domain-containing protein [Pseudidiomarina marina]|uniref:DUF2868 domain-containing protein n=1 Tax=Pseudidiomarina marina TaxID=502366 RepID=A0A432YJI2_9GAMM|nr:DUF2868 domain-containing protein [Pseudidiomarina marina]RUO61141.1 hypothetical protein CWI76_02410 [Pseudidiomarina marina]
MLKIFSRFRSVWMAELVRRHELQNGFQRADAIEQQARQLPTMEQRVFKRAELLAARLGLVHQLRVWDHFRRLIAILLSVFAIMGAIAIVRGTLSVTQPISLSYALMMLLGLHIILFVLWCFSLIIKDSFGWVGRISLWGLEHIGQRQYNQQFNNTLLTIANQYGLTKPAGAALTHGYWTLFMLAVWFVLFFHLSTSAYAFTWATTIWPAETLQSWVSVIGLIPSLFGVEAPSVAALWDQPRESAQLEAGRWLLSCVIIYGVAWRLIFLIGSISVLISRIRKMTIDLTLPGYAPIIRKLTVSAATELVDADSDVSGIDTAQWRTPKPGHGELVISLDHEADSTWLKQHQQENWYAGVIARSDDKQRLLARLDEHPVGHLTVRLNAQLTPDRAAMRFLTLLQQYCLNVEATLVIPENTDEKRIIHWQECLTEEGVKWKQ